MSFKNLVNRSPFFIRLLHWEYWPFYVVQLPVMCYYVWLSVKARNFFYFSASNPSIETGGMFGESKWRIFEIIPKHLFPATILVKEGMPLSNILAAMQQKGISFPIIAKPDRGERGWKVAKIKDDAGLLEYAQSMQVDFLIQSYVDLPVEMSVFYFRYPNQQTGTISSVVIKELLRVTGDGKSTLLELIEAYPRALLQLPVLKITLADKINTIPATGEIVELVPYGNHSRGAMFLDACHLINEQMTKVFDDISKSIPDFYFGRYDLRCQSIELLKHGKSIQIMELNGCGAEAAHIYHPGSSLIKAYEVIFYHFKVMYEISVANHKRGVPYMSWAEFISIYNIQKAYVAKASKKN